VTTLHLCNFRFKDSQGLKVIFNRLIILPSLVVMRCHVGVFPVFVKIMHLTIVISKMRTISVLLLAARDIDDVLVIIVFKGAIKHIDININICESTHILMS
jgi:hypothetical protein